MRNLAVGLICGFLLGFGTFALLTMRPTSNTTKIAQSAQSPVSTAPAAPPPEAPTAIPSKPEAINPEWVVLSDRDKMDGHTIDTLVMPTENRAEQLYVRCEHSRPEVFINTGDQLETEFRGGESVRLKFDDESPVTQHWSQSTSGTSLFSPTPQKFLAKARASKTLLFEYAPFEKRPTTATFILSGLNDKLAPLAAACGMR